MWCGIRDETNEVPHRPGVVREHVVVHGDDTSHAGADDQVDGLPGIHVPDDVEGLPLGVATVDGQERQGYAQSLERGGEVGVVEPVAGVEEGGSAQPNDVAHIGMLALAIRVESVAVLRAQPV